MRSPGGGKRNKESSGACYLNAVTGPAASVRGGNPFLSEKAARPFSPGSPSTLAPEVCNRRRRERKKVNAVRYLQ